MKDWEKRTEMYNGEDYFETDIFILFGGAVCSAVAISIYKVNEDFLEK